MDPMKSFFKTTFSYALLFSFLLFSAGCDSNDSNDETEAFADMAATIGKTFSLLTQAFTQIGPATKTAMPPVDCSNSGTFDVSDVTDNSYSIAFSDCNGIDGSLTFGITYSITETSISTGFSMDGSITDTCTLTMNNFSFASVTTPQNPSVGTLTYNGGFSSDCGGNSYSCVFNDAEVDLQTGASASFMQSNCTLSN